MSKKQHTSKGQPVTDEQIERLAAEAEAGYDIEKLHRRGGRNRSAAPQPASSVRPTLN